MKKYILLGFPLIFYGEGLLHFFSDLHFYWPFLLQVLLNIAIITVCMIFLLKRTRLHNVLDWFVAICFSVYFCVLYHKTIQFMFVFGNIHYSFENLKYIVRFVNLVPIKGIIDVLHYNPSVTFQIIGNFIMLTPFALYGVCLHYWRLCRIITNKKYKKKM